MLKLNLVISFCFAAQLCFGQHVPKTYHTMDTVRRYDRFEYDALNGNQEAYDSMMYYRNFKRNQCLLYVLMVDTNNLVRDEFTACGDCNVGDNKGYYPNGNLKYLTRYKKNYGTNWDSIYYKGFCNILDGEQVLFNSNGDTSYVEIWKNGDFVSQTPEQSICEIWGLDVLVNDSILLDSTISISQIGALKFEPKYKNSNTDQELTFTIVLERRFKDGSGKYIYTSEAFTNTKPSTDVVKDFLDMLDLEVSHNYYLKIDAITKEPYGFQFEYRIKP
jgi:hypothetical protein